MMFLSARGIFYSFGLILTLDPDSRNQSVQSGWVMKILQSCQFVGTACVVSMACLLGLYSMSG